MLSFFCYTTLKQLHNTFPFIIMVQSKNRRFLSSSLLSTITTKHFSTSMMVGERATLLESKIPRKLRSANNPGWVRYLVGETVKNDDDNPY